MGSKGTLLYILFVACAASFLAVGAANMLHDSVGKLEQVVETVK